MVHTQTDRNALKLFLVSLLDVFLPRSCASCSCNLPPDEKIICNLCLSRLKMADDLLLKKEYWRKFSKKNIISDYKSLYIFEKDKELQNIIHNVKYRNRYLTAKYLGQIAGKAFQEEISGWSIQLIIPVPLHKIKTTERGYNQSYYFAAGVSAVTNIPLTDKAVCRKKYTASQTSMTLSEREKNITGAFDVKNKKLVQGKTILLVDDVITTGATLNECGKILKKNGAAAVFALSAAIAE